MAIYCSSSIENFREKALRRFRLSPRNVFVGLYHIGDYVRFLSSLGKWPTVVWCGSDIRALEKRPVAQWFIRCRKFVEHVCENEVEQRALSKMGIYAYVQPFFFGDKDKYFVTFKPSRTPHVFISVREGREEEYGLWKLLYASLWCPKITFHVYGVQGCDINNVKYHGNVTEEQFDREIRDYHACVRLNEFDGFSDAVAKSVLNGQYPITAIKYPHIDQATGMDELIMKLRALKYKQGPNPAQKYWREIL